MFKTKLEDSNSKLKKEETQEAKDEAARLAAEAAIFEKAQNGDYDPEALPNRLLDFVDEYAAVGTSPILPEPPTGLSHEAEANQGTVLSTNVTAETVKSSTSLRQPKSAVSFEVPQSSSSEKPKETLPSYLSWIGELQAQPSALTSTNNQKPLFCGHSARDSLPKLRLNKFDGDPLHWSD